MGLGDDVMASGRAARMHAGSGRKVVIGPPGSRYWSAAFDHAPYLVQPDEGESGADRLYDYPGHRPYIDYAMSTPTRQVLIPEHRPRPGALYFSQFENEVAQRWLVETGAAPGYVLIAPHIKQSFSGPNKGWPRHHWHDLLSKLHDRDIETVIAAPPDSGCALGADHHILHADVRRSLALLRYASCVVCPEGLFHHAAAALGVPAVVLWGARTDPRILGYPGHVNLTHGSDWCGSMRERCDHCAAAMEAITPDRVVEAVEDVQCRTLAE